MHNTQDITIHDTQFYRETLLLLQLKIDSSDYTRHFHVTRIEVCEELFSIVFAKFFKQFDVKFVALVFGDFWGLCGYYHERVPMVFQIRMVSQLFFYKNILLYKIYCTNSRIVCWLSFSVMCFKMLLNDNNILLFCLIHAHKLYLSPWLFQSGWQI